MKSRYSRIVAILMFSVCAIGVAKAQKRAPTNSTTYTAPDGAFRFSYPSDFAACTDGKIEPCIHSYIPVCDRDALVCVVSPAKQFEDTVFEAASFQVKEIFREATMIPDLCVTPYPREDGAAPEFFLSAKHPTEMIGGVQFVHGVSEDGGMSHWMSTDLYRTFHKHRCFEISISETGSDAKSFDPPKKTLTAAQQRKLDQSMSQILHSFRFSK